MADRGAPKGNTNSVDGRRWTAAIDRALAKRCKGDGIAALDELAEKFLDEAVESGIAGFKELADRLDGRPAQTLQGPDGAPLLAGIEVTFK